MGPGDQHTARFLDLLDSVRVHEADILAACDLVVVHDGNVEAALSAQRMSDFRSVTALMNPSGPGDALWDRVTQGMLTGVRWFLDRGPYDLLLRLDDDALVIQPFVRRLAERFAAHPEWGIVGSVTTFPDGSPNQGVTTLQHLVTQAARPVPELGWLRRWHRGRVLRAAWSLKQRASIRTGVVRRALANGYRSAEHAVGGALAVNGAAVAAWAASTWFPMPDAFRYSLMPDDLILAMCASAAGYDVVDLNGPGEPFGVWWEQPTMDARTLLERGHGIVHAIKEFEAFDEQAFRQAMRWHRRNEGGALP